MAILLVKVQAPLAVVNMDPHFLIYDENRSLEVQLPVSDYPNIKAAMKGRAKAFFACGLLYPDVFFFGPEIPDLGW